jgi:hypothetical protein
VSLQWRISEEEDQAAEEDSEAAAEEADSEAEEEDILITKRNPSKKAKPTTSR